MLPPSRMRGDGSGRAPFADAFDRFRGRRAVNGGAGRRERQRNPAGADLDDDNVHDDLQLASRDLPGILRRPRYPANRRRDDNQQCQRQRIMSEQLHERGTRLPDQLRPRIAVAVTRSAQRGDGFRAPAHQRPTWPGVNGLGRKVDGCHLILGLRTRNNASNTTISTTDPGGRHDRSHPPQQTSRHRNTVKSPRFGMGRRAFYPA